MDHIDIEVKTIVRSAMFCPRSMNSMLDLLAHPHIAGTHMSRTIIN